MHVLGAEPFACHASAVPVVQSQEEGHERCRLLAEDEVPYRPLLETLRITSVLNTSSLCICKEVTCGLCMGSTLILWYL
jgi:hypothetical protein